VQQDGRENAQHRETDRHDGIGNGIFGWRRCHTDQRSHIPEKSEGGGNAGQQAALNSRPSPIGKEKVQKDSEGDGTGAVSDGIHENRRVQAEAVRHPVD
jgi:hypothetical protein